MFPNKNNPLVHVNNPCYTTPMKQTTIIDIAKAAGVSHTTVSRALNNSPLIKESTKDKIKQIAVRMDYTPDINAKRLVLNRSFNIGIFFTSVRFGTSPSFFHQIYTAADEFINGKFNLSINSIAEFSKQAMISPRDYDGILIVSQSDSDDGFIHQVLKSKIPAVLINRKCDLQIKTFMSQDREGVSEAVSHLIKSNHRRIAFIKGEKGFFNTDERFEGYKSALQKANIPVDIAIIKAGHNRHESGYSATRLLLQSQEVDAVFCSNDEMAMGAIRAIAEAGLKCPDDISVIGVDGTPFTEFTTPPLSTVFRDFTQLVKDAIHCLMEQIDGKTVSPSIEYYSTEFIERSSSR